jgi:rhodanese-related sulfurtransferase
MMRHATTLAALIGAVAACAPAAWPQGTEVLSGNCPVPMLAMANAVPAPAPEHMAPEDEAAPEAWQACRLTLAQFLRNRARFTMIDTRASGERRRVGIPGALSIDVKELPAKAFLENADIALVGSGLNDDELAAHCAALRAAPRLRVGVLEGGVRALHGAAQTLAGDSVDIAQLDWVSVEELHRLVLRIPDQVALVDLDETLVLQPALDRAQRLGSGGDWARTAAALQKMSERQTRLPLIAIASNEAGTAALHAALNAAQARRVFVVRDGLPAYQAYLDAQQRIAANANLKLIRSCGSS